MFRTSITILKYAALCSATGATVGTLYKNDWNVSSTGLVRFGRAAVCVSHSLVLLFFKKLLVRID